MITNSSNIAAMPPKKSIPTAPVAHLEPFPVIALMASTKEVIIAMNCKRMFKRLISIRYDFLSRIALILNSKS
jgi:hypothetical protein